MKKEIWKSNGYYPFFGIKIPECEYILTEDAITVSEGITLHKSQTVPLYRIAAMEVSSSIIGRMFKCGSVNLITRGREVPDLVLRVKEPERQKKIQSEE